MDNKRNFYTDAMNYDFENSWIFGDGEEEEEDPEMEYLDDEI